MNGIIHCEPPPAPIVHPSFSSEYEMLQWKARFSSETLLLPFLRMWQESTDEDVLVLPLRNHISKGTIFLKEQEWLFPLSRYEMQKVLWAQNKGGHMGGAYAARSSPCWPLPGSERCRTPLHPHFTCSTNFPQPVFNPGVAPETPRPSSVWLGGLLCFFVLFFLPCFGGILGLPWFGF